MDERDTILHGDALTMLATLPDASVHMCVTSPPYFGLRDYGVPGQIGLESSVEEYVQVMVDVFAEVRRVLRNDGTLWLNLGDSYAGGDKWTGRNDTDRDTPGGRGGSFRGGIRVKAGSTRDLKPKDLIGVPWRVAFALQAAGWWLRSDIIWAKKNCMPESVTDRPTRSHEYIFLLAKSERYYYDADAIMEPVTGGSHPRTAGPNSRIYVDRDPAHLKPGVTPKSARPGLGIKANSSFHAVVNDLVTARNKRTVWSVATQPYSGAHFATFPHKLIEPCILAGCPPGGVVLDPFFGSGTVGEVAIRHSRHYLGIELNAAYIKLAEKRLGKGIQRVLWSAS